MGYVIKNDKGYIASEVQILNDIEKKILHYSLHGATKSEIAKKLGISLQLVSYYINKKLKDFVYVKDGKIYSKKAYYFIISDDPDFTVEYSTTKELYPFIENRILNSIIVVGSPFPHGPFSAVGRDSHYIGFLLAYLGKFFDKTLYDDYIRLDVDIIREKLLDNNLILIGGPVTNVVTYRVNKYLDVYFDEENNWNIYDKKKKIIYSDEFNALIANITNPFNNSKKILVLAGKKVIGTKIAIKYFINKNYNLSKNFIEVIRGLDIDGDGVIDKIVSESYIEL